MSRAERVERGVEIATAIRLAAAVVEDRQAAGRLGRAERLVLRDVGPSVPKRRAAALLGISVTALQRWIATGRLPVARRPGGREEVDSAALLDVLEEVRRLREDDGVTRGAVARAFHRLAVRGLPRRKLRPNGSPQELRASYLHSTPGERFREAAELSYAATTLVRHGARRRARETNAA